MFGDIVTIGKREARLIILILLICFVGAFALSYGYIKFLNKKNTPPIPAEPLPEKTEILPNATAALSLTTEQKSVSRGDTFSISLAIDTDENKVEAADFVINFDGSLLAAREIKQGSFFGVLPVKNIENSRIKISGMANLIGDTIVVPKGKGEVAAIVFEARRSADKTVISIDPSETIIASSGKNILDPTKITDLAVEIK
jgi:hypothetical protein